MSNLQTLELYLLMQSVRCKAAVHDWLHLPTFKLYFFICGAKCYFDKSKIERKARESEVLLRGTMMEIQFVLFL